MKALLCTASLLCALCAANAAHYITIDPNIKSTWTRPWFCHDLECPPFKNLTREGDRYETREYEPATFYYVNVTGLPFVAAYAKADLKLLRYTAGANLKGVKIDRTTPALTRFKPTDKEYTGAEKDYVVAYYLPPSLQEDPPRPESPDIGIIRAPSTLAYVASFGGFGVETNILSNAKALRDKLHEDGRRFDDSRFWFHLYDAPTKLFNRYNEVAFEGSRH